MIKREDVLLTDEELTALLPFQVNEAFDDLDFTRTIGEAGARKVVKLIEHLAHPPIDSPGFNFFLLDKEDWQEIKRIVYG